MKLSLAGILAPLVLLGCTTTPAAPQSPECTLVQEGFGPRGTVAVRAETVVAGLEVPWGIAFVPGGDMLVTERPGRIRLVREGKIAATVATVDVHQGDEGGLLGIALHPNFANNRLFYVYATVDANDKRQNRVLRYTLAADHVSATFDRVIVSDIGGAPYHDGGRLRFGPDGMLYIGTGDAREPDSSQSMSNANGKILRVTPDGAVPADNPFPNSSIFILGIRNTQGFDWLDAQTLLVTDHGPSGDTGRRGHDEVSVARRGDNLGWPGIYSCEAKKGNVTPSLTWEEAAPPGGAAIYTGDAIPEWKGSLLVGTLRSTHLHRVLLDPKNPGRVAQHEVYFEGEPPKGLGRLREVIMGLDKQLYVTTSNCDGRGECAEDKDRIVRITK
jgi:glucose/arabinose dehydrogenase